MSGSNRKKSLNLCGFLRNESAWADFFITRVGFIFFAAVLLILAFKVYPVFYDSESRAELGSIASDLASKIEAIDATAIQDHRYIHTFDNTNKNVKMEISTEFIVTSINVSTGEFGEKKLRHVEPLMTRVYPPNSFFQNASGLRALNISKDKMKVDKMFENITKELAQTPFSPDMNRSLIMEKVTLIYSDKTEFQSEDHILIYQ